jgi:hypothetical protein
MSGRHRGHRRTTVAIVYGVQGEPELVLCDAATDPPWQCWFTVVLDDATGRDGPSEAPRLGRGLDVALEHRGAQWDGERWVPAPELWDE